MCTVLRDKSNEVNLLRNWGQGNASQHFPCHAISRNWYSCGVNAWDSLSLSLSTLDPVSYSKGLRGSLFRRAVNHLHVWHNGWGVFIECGLCKEVVGQVIIWATFKSRVFKDNQKHTHIWVMVDWQPNSENLWCSVPLSVRRFLPVTEYPIKCDFVISYHEYDQAQAWVSDFVRLSRNLAFSILVSPWDGYLSFKHYVFTQQ